MKPWYEKLFENYAQSYEKESFTQGTKAEVDFVEQEAGYNKSLDILDIGCGTGRHSLELARRGYRVKGIDLSENMLEKAREKARKENLKVEFARADARYFDYPEQFDLAIMICEGAFPLMETDEMNNMILENAFRALRYPGKFIFTTLNGLFPLFYSVKDFINANLGTSETLVNNFDLMTFRDHSEYKFVDDDGKTHILKCNERYYVPSEISWLLKSAGFDTVEIFGCQTGSFSRKVPLSAGDYEMLVVAEKIKKNEG